MKYYIVGYMYSGKSTYGRQMAAERGLRFVDLDRLFEARFHYTVPRFFAQFGEAAFRRLEQQVLHSTADLDDVVVATGGGTPCYADNMDFIICHGTAIYLNVSVDTLVDRALRSRNPRPRLQGLTPDELRRHIAAELKSREPFYLRAHVHIDSASRS